MSERIRRHIRQNVVGYVALFLVISGGTAYATHPGGADTIDSADIINDSVKAADIRNDSLSGGGLVEADLRPDSVGASEVINGSLTGTEINESTLSSAVPRTAAAADDSFAPGPGNRLEANVGLGALFVATCLDGGTTGNDSDDTVTIDVVNLNPAPFQVFIESANAPGNTAGVNSHWLSRLVLGQNTSAGDLPAPIATRRFYVSPLGDSQSAIIAEATGHALPGSDDCAGVIQATRSK